MLVHDVLTSQDQGEADIPRLVRNQVRAQAVTEYQRLKGYRSSRQVRQGAGGGARKQQLEGIPSADVQWPTPRREPSALFSVCPQNQGRVSHNRQAGEASTNGTCRRFAVVHDFPSGVERDLLNPETKTKSPARTASGIGTETYLGGWGREFKFPAPATPSMRSLGVCALLRLACNLHRSHPKSCPLFSGRKVFQTGRISAPDQASVAWS